MKRDTIAVRDMLCFANTYLHNTHDDLVGQRKGVIDMIEAVLIKANNYGGFGYLNENYMKVSEHGKSVGIIYDESGAGKHIRPDETRRCYRLKTW